MFHNEGLWARRTFDLVVPFSDWVISWRHSETWTHNQSLPNIAKYNQWSIVFFLHTGARLGVILIYAGIFTKFARRIKFHLFFCWFFFPSQSINTATQIHHALGKSEHVLVLDGRQHFYSLRFWCCELSVITKHHFSMRGIFLNPCSVWWLYIDYHFQLSSKFIHLLSGKL